MARKYHKKTPRQKLIKDLDDICRLIIRIRDDYVCQWCGKNIKDAVHDVHHIVRRTHLRTRWDLLNLILLCYLCHKKFHDGLEGKDWFAEKFKVRWDYLNAGLKDDFGKLIPRKNLSWKPTIDDLEKLYEQLKQKVKELQED